MTNEPTSMDFEIDKTVGNEGEYGVKFNEPTTGELIKCARQCFGDEWDEQRCKGCSRVTPYHCSAGRVIDCKHELGVIIADRLESQEQKIAELTKEPDYGDLTEEKDCMISLLASLVRTHPQWKPTVNVTLGLIAKLVDSRSRLVTAVSELTLQVGELTARAESAERERDAAIERLNNAMRGVEGIKRGLPQDGEGV